MGGFKRSTLPSVSLPADHRTPAAYRMHLSHAIPGQYSGTRRSSHVAETGLDPRAIAEWRRSQRIVLEANPNFRTVHYPAAPPGPDAEIAKGLTGRKLPLTPRVEIAIVEEAQPRLLAFRRGEVDYVEVPRGIAQPWRRGYKRRPFARDEWAYYEVTAH